jgi:flagellar biosynthesis/type III secretory pathway protein FliH
MKIQPTKFDRALKISIFMPVVFLAVFVLSGCKKADVQTDNAENKIDVEELSNKVNELQQFKDEQQEKEALAKQQEEETIKQAEIDKCNALKKSCEAKEKSAQEQLSYWTKYDRPSNKDCDKIKDSGTWEGYEEQRDENIKACKKSNDTKNNEIDTNINKYKDKLSSLLSGECKDYKNPCE